MRVCKIKHIIISDTRVSRFISYFLTSLDIQQYHMNKINGDLPILGRTDNTNLWFSHDLRQNNFLFYNSKRKEKIPRPIYNSYPTFSDITGYQTILYETKASIYEKTIKTILDSINGIIIIIGHIIMISIGYFLTNIDLKDTLGYIKFWYFLTK